MTDRIARGCAAAVALVLTLAGSVPPAAAATAAPPAPGTTAPPYPAQQCGTGGAGTSALVGVMPGSLAHYGQNTIVGFPAGDPGGNAYIASLVSVASGPASPAPSAPPMAPINTMALAHSMQFATEAPNGTFTCRNLAPRTPYVFVATVYVDEWLAINGGKKTLFQGVATYWKETLSTAGSGTTLYYTSRWAKIGTTLPNTGA
jgi:hypothetical protein